MDGRRPWSHCGVEASQLSTPLEVGRATALEIADAARTRPWLCVGPQAVREGVFGRLLSAIEEERCRIDATDAVRIVSTMMAA
jgi:hypothetical protein